MKALFFLRHYNDIDHIVPVVHKWASCGFSCDVVLCGASKCLGDYRVDYLRALATVRVDHISDILTPKQMIGLRGLALCLHPDAQRGITKPLSAIAALLIKGERRQKFWQKIAEQVILRSFQDHADGAVAFDWISTRSMLPLEFVTAVSIAARSAGLRIVSLPHGDSPHASQLIRDNELDIVPSDKYACSHIFDCIAVPNELCAERYRPYLSHDRVRVLGSPRFCSEWLTKLDELAPANPLTGDDSRKKIAMFLRKPPFSIFWAEVKTVIKLISEFADVDLIVKGHTRHGLTNPLRSYTSGCTKLPNVRFVGDEVHSIHLMDWADVSIDLATSVIFEAVRKRKPILAADYLHAGRSTVAHYMPETALLCRDDVYQRIRNLSETTIDGFYNELNRDRFLQEVLDSPSADVLQSYVDLLCGDRDRHIEDAPITQQMDASTR